MIKCYKYPNDHTLAFLGGTKIRIVIDLCYNLGFSQKNVHFGQSKFVPYLKNFSCKTPVLANFIQNYTNTFTEVFLKEISKVDREHRSDF